MLPLSATNPIEASLCPIRTVLAKVSGKWQVLILFALDDGALRFGQIKRTIGDITQKMVSENLRSLERDGYLTRTVFSGPPVAVSYELTPTGYALVNVLKPVVFWANDNLEQVKAARSNYDLRNQSL